MGFVVLHIDKASGNDAGMTAHIERTIDPANTDKQRTHLNRKLIEFPKGVDNRTQAIQHRIDTAGITRKVGTNQVRALRIMLSGTPEDMQRIEAGGKLGEWCEDNLAWLRKTYGADNVVSAVLHMDEKTPHIHATVVPIVTGERRKAAAKPAEPGKKPYRKKKADAPRLCADDVMSRPKLNEHLRTVLLCQYIGLTIDAIKQLFNGEVVSFTGKLHSPEHDQTFNVQDVKLQIFKEQDNPNKFRLSLNGQNILDWFKQKYQDMKQVIRPHIKPPAKSEVGKNKGFKR